MSLEFQCRREAFFRNELSLYVYNKVDSQSVAVPLPVVFKVMPRDEGAYEPIQPLLRLDPEGAQRLMDELFAAGIRPSEGSGSAGQLAAVKSHLADMRALVFKTDAPK